MQLISTSTEKAIEPGAMLHVVQGPAIGQAWRFEKITPHSVDGHRVHCTRSHPRMGRIHREFHPGVFGARVVIEITWHRHVRNTARRVWAKVDDYLWAGAFALVPLAFYEHYHVAERVAELSALIGH